MHHNADYNAECRTRDNLQRRMSEQFFKVVFTARNLRLASCARNFTRLDDFSLYLRLVIGDFTP